MIGLSDLRKGVAHLPKFISEYGPIAGPRRLVGLGHWRTIHQVEGQSIFNEDWDVCIILDACRADELERKQGHYEWLNEIGRYLSVGSCTWQWLPRTFDENEDNHLDNTVYVSANPFTETFCDPDDFHTLDEVYNYAWDEEIGTVRPRPVTDRAIHHGRTKQFNRMIIHYLQPHVPFLVDQSVPLRREGFREGARGHDDDWDLVAKGELERETAIKWYRETLSKVLEDVDILLSNIDAEDIVITADHGEAFGEWGLYGHPGGVALPCLIEVPWLETTATDEETHEPADYDTEGHRPNRDEQLKALGYK